MKDIPFSAALPPDMRPAGETHQSQAPPPARMSHHAVHPPAEAGATHLSEPIQTDKVIRKVGSKWVLYFSDGRKEEFSSKGAAEKRERQIQYFKHRKK